MFFSYTVSVVLMSLALYGAWCVLKDIWEWYLEPKLLKMPSATFLILVRDQEQVIEDLIRYLIREIELNDQDCDAVVVDCGSTDLTPAILERLAEESTVIKVARLTEGSRPAGETLPLCSGGVIHILDLVNRLSSSEFMVTVCALLKQDGREIYVKNSSSD